MDVYCLVSYYSDGSGEPQVLKVYRNKEDAVSDFEMIDCCNPTKEIAIFPSIFAFEGGKADE